jgi:hypothetical protein
MRLLVLRLWGEIGDDVRNSDNIYVEYVLGMTQEGWGVESSG